MAAGGAASIQVLNEVANVARRNMRSALADVRAFLGLLRGVLTVHPLTLKTHDAGLALAERYGLSIYGAMIAASALGAGCATLGRKTCRTG